LTGRAHRIHINDTSGVATVGPYGEGRYFNGSSQCVWELPGGVPGNPLTNQPASLMLVGSPMLAGDVSGDFYFGMGQTSAANFCFTRSGAASDRLVFTRASAGSNAKSVAHDFGSDPGYRVFMGTHPGGNNYGLMYVDGLTASIDSTATAGTLGSGSHNRIGAGRSGSTNANLSTLSFVAGYIWTRQLTDDDALWLGVEPFAFLEENHFVKYFFLGMSTTSATTGGARRFSSIARSRG
jgi:hypothetical protein